MRYGTIHAVLLFVAVANADIGYRASLIRFPDQRRFNVWAVNDAGVVTGGAVDPASGRFHVGIWTAEEGPRDLGALIENGQAEGVAVNNSNVIVGFGDTANGSTLIRWSEADGFTSFPALYASAVINDSGWIAGQYTVGSLFGNAALWRPGIGYTIIGDLPGGPRDAIPTAINNNGVVCGIGYEATQHRAFLWDQVNGLRAMELMPDEAVPQYSSDMNNLGQVIGSSYTCGPIGFLWDPEAGYTRLEVGPNYQEMEPLAINDRTEIVGAGINNPGYSAWVYDPRAL